MAASKDIAELTLGELKSLATWLISPNISLAYSGGKAFTTLDKPYIDEPATALDKAIIQ